MKKVAILILIMAGILTLFAGCKAKAAESPNEEEMELALHARVIKISEDRMEVTITEDNVDEDRIYSFSIEDCEFYIERDVISNGVPILIIPSETFDSENTSPIAKKVYGLGN